MEQRPSESCWKVTKSSVDSLYEKANHDPKYDDKKPAAMAVKLVENS